MYGMQSTAFCPMTVGSVGTSLHASNSTNTNPSWERAHPNRFMVHNGEINTIKGNSDKMLAREETMESEHLKGQLSKVLPVVNTSGSIIVA